MLPSRRDWLRQSAAGLFTWSASGWLSALAAGAARDPQRKRSCILLWMSGGPSQMDTFDLKPGHANGGPFKEIATSVPGIKISEHLPKVAKLADRMALVRSMSTKEGEHGLATYFAHTGYAARGPIQYPTLGSLVAKEAGAGGDLPAFVSVAPFRTFSSAAHAPGFLGPKYAPLIVGDSGPSYAALAGRGADADALKVANLAPPAGVGREQFEARLRLAREMQREFVSGRPGAVAEGHATAYESATRLLGSDAARVFDLDQETAALRDAYGRGLFGQGCLLARRLVERGVPFVEVSLGGAAGVGWDTHINNFETVRELSASLDAGWSALMTDLKDRGLLDTTLIVWMGEFGRTPKINGDRGRDHFPAAWTAVLAGGGIRGGQVIGQTSAGGEAVEERPVTMPDFLATVCAALGIDPTKQNESNIGRPIRITDLGAKPIKDVIA
jgi:uncharacterized protein (DUF1501 family)